jgi:iron complex outermembrane receptor protein
VIKFDSAKPVFKTEGYLQLGVGNYSAKTVEGVFNVPVSDTVALRFSGTSQHRDDRVHNTNPNTEHRHPGLRRLRRQRLPPAGPGTAEQGLQRAVQLPRARLPRFGHAVPRQHHQEGHQRPGGRLRLRLLPDRRRQLPEAGNQGRQYPPEVQPERPDAALDHRLRNAEVQQPRRRRRRLRRRVRAAIGSGLHPFPVETADLLPNHKQFSQEFRAESNYAGPLQWIGGLFFFNENIQIDSISFNSFAPAIRRTPPTRSSSRTPSRGRRSAR